MQSKFDLTWEKSWTQTSTQTLLKKKKKWKMEIGRQVPEHLWSAWACLIVLQILSRSQASSLLQSKDPHMNAVITILQFPNKQLQTWYRLSYDQSLMLIARSCGTWSRSCSLLLHQQRVENFNGYLLTRSAVAWCSTDEVEDGITLERVSTRPVSPCLDWVHRVTSVVIVYSD